jgi:hypothetical protein
VAFWLAARRRDDALDDARSRCWDGDGGAGTGDTAGEGEAMAGTVPGDEAEVSAMMREREREREKREESVSCGVRCTVYFSRRDYFWVVIISYCQGASVAGTTWIP